MTMRAGMPAFRRDVCVEPLAIAVGSDNMRVAMPTLSVSRMQAGGLRTSGNYIRLPMPTTNLVN